jgi:hypothetical protein
VLELGRRIMGLDQLGTGQFDDLVLRQLAGLALAGGPLADELERALDALGEEPGPARLLDLLIRLGPYGDGFGRNPDGLTLPRVAEHEHGLDLGPSRREREPPARRGGRRRAQWRRHVEWGARQRGGGGSRILTPGRETRPPGSRSVHRNRAGLRSEASKRSLWPWVKRSAAMGPSPPLVTMPLPPWPASQK